MVVSLVTLDTTGACRAYGFGTHTGAPVSQSSAEIYDFAHTWFGSLLSRIASKWHYSNATWVQWRRKSPKDRLFGRKLDECITGYPIFIYFTTNVNQFDNKSLA